MRIVHGALIMSPLYSVGDILLYLSTLNSSDQFCVCAFSPSIVQAVKHEMLTQCRAFVGQLSTTLSQHYPSNGLPCRDGRHTECGPALQTAGQH